MNPNSKIYNKLLFVCGDENIKSESYKLSHIFSTNCIRSHDGWSHLVLPLAIVVVVPYIF